MLEQRALNTHLLRRALAGLGLASLAPILIGASTGRGPLVSAAAALFALAVSVVAVVSNFDVWRGTPPADANARLAASAAALQSNAWLGALAYAWGALAMGLLYMKPLTGLWWQHGWQYALAMTLLAGISAGYARALGAPSAEGRAGSQRAGAALAAVQAAVAVGGLIFLGVSGKLAAQKADWAANRMFAALALSVLAISMAALVSEARLRGRA